MKVAVVGAGLGGLAVAARLAAAGHDVDVFEQAPRPGGKLGHAHLAGCVFDTGPSLLTLPDVLRETLAATGGEVDALELQELSPLTRVRFGDGTAFDTRSDRAAFHEALEQWEPGAGAQFEAFFARAGRLWDATHTTFLERELRGPGTLARLALARPRDLPLVAPWQSLAQFAARDLSDPRLQQFVWRYATYTGSDPRRAPAALAAIPYAELSFGGWYVRGGLHRIASELAARAAEHGARLHYDTAVSAVSTEGGRATGVVAGGTRVTADAVVSAVDAAVLYDRLLPADARVGSARRALARSRPSYSGLVLLLAVRGPRDPGRPAHTVLLPRNYTAEFDALAAGRPVVDPAVYVSVPADPTVAGPDAHPWFVLVNAPRHGPFDWDAVDRDAVAGDILRRMADRGLDVRDRVVARTLRTPADLERDTGSPGGAIYGTSSDGPRAAFLRPRNRSPLRGLFLVGGSAHPGGGIPLVLLSARITAGLLAG